MEEIAIDYSECKDKAPLAPATSDISDKVTYSFKSKKKGQSFWQKLDDSEDPVCSLTFDIPNDIGPPVFMYYRLTNFYQNHRRYVQSLELEQLKGKAVDNKTIKGGTCDPDPVKLDPHGKAYYPCGLIANSVFNDTISSPKLTNRETYFMTNKGIAWESDKELFQKTEYEPWQVSPPPNWQRRYPNYTKDNMPNLHEDEELMVWMRTAGLPNFSKLSRRNDTDAMPAGTYRLNITHRMF